MSLLLVPLCISLIIALLIAINSYLLFFRAARRDAAPTPPAALVARGVAYSVAGVALAMVLYPFGPWFRRRCRPCPFPRRAAPQVGNHDGSPCAGRAPVAAPCPKLPPVLLIHGLYHNVTAWTLYRRWLMQAGFTRVYCHGYSSWHTEFGLLVDELDETVRDLLAAYPDERPLLMGHSLGGLLIRGWLADSANQQLVAGAVTLGTPHQGSTLARLGAGRLARSLAFRGALIRELEATEAPSDVPCVALYSPIDNMVVPQEGLHVTTPGWTLRASPAVSHIWMLWDRNTARLAIESLRELAARNAARERDCAAEDRREHGSEACPNRAAHTPEAAGHSEKVQQARNGDGTECAADRKASGYSRA
ncbi:esterase/lipase family protein [Nitratidesulfovibrio oxamicus]|uniref:esterase/lipase family protein n=1 Tax=Nitratidesulfovibrio oxamicus TaxID=32016 RepID=UPI001E5A436E|nr:alpha/beta fold hydrolase [Nitratidesulfovibrio oxamicus]